MLNVVVGRKQVRGQGETKRNKLQQVAAARVRHKGCLTAGLSCAGAERRAGDVAVL